MANNGLPMSVVDGKRRARAELRRRAGDLLLRWPLYDAWRRVLNRDAQRLFQTEQLGVSLSAAEVRAVESLRSDGVAIVHLNELLPAPVFDEISAWAEGLARQPSVQERIESIAGGAKPEAKGGKYYIIRPLGDAPQFSIDDRIVQAAVSDPILRVVAGYLGMCPRISALDLWYNLPTGGQEVLSQRWHRDPEDRALVKTFLYLRDCQEENGPFCYIPGTHRTGKLRHRVGGYNYPDDGVVESQFPAERRRACTGRAGTLIFCDTTGYHKGGHATAGARFLFNTVYTTNASEPIIRGWNPHCTLTGSAGNLGAAARYAVGWLQSPRRPFGGRFA